MLAVAAKVGVSVRSLEIHFNKYLSATPKQVISLIRLAATRRRLLEITEGQSSVTEIAEGGELLLQSLNQGVTCSATVPPT